MAITHIGTNHDIKFRAIRFAIIALQNECRARRTAEHYETVPTESLTSEIYANAVATIYGMPKVTINHIISEAVGPLGPFAAIKGDQGIAAIVHKVMEKLHEVAYRESLAPQA